VHGFLVSLIHAASALESVLNLLATIEQNWCCDGGLVFEFMRFSGGVVRQFKTTAHQALDYCLAVVKSKSPSV